MTIVEKERGLTERLEEESFGGCTLRVREARQRVLSTVPSICLEKAKIMTEVFMKTEAEPRVMRQAKAFRETCERKTIFIQDDELIVSSPASKIRAGILGPDTDYWILSDEVDTISTREQDPYLITEDQKKLFKEFIEPYWKGKSFWDVWNATAPEELRQLNEAIVACILSGKDQSGHSLFVPNYELVIKIGINGIRKRINERLASLDAAIPGHYEKIVYLNALLIVCDGMDTLAKRYARLAREKAAREKQPQRKAGLEKIAEICQRVPTNPARTFWEALQSLWFYHVCTLIDYGCASNNPGRMDQYLYPYYKKDIEEGRLTKEQAQELLECLWVKFSEVLNLVDKDYARFVPGYARFQNVACGGITAGGQDGVNELSYMMIQATMDVRLAQPSFAVKYNKRKNPDSFLRKAAELVALGTGHPQFYNDEVGIKYLMDLGIPFGDAYNWSINSCKDLGLTGKIGSPRVPAGINLAAAVELTLLNGVSRLTKSRLPVPQTGDPRNFKTYEEFKEAVKAQLTYLIKKAAEIALIIEATLQEQNPALLVSLSCEECIESAKDCMAGGTKYNPGPEIVVTGHADIINSLAVIKKLIYDDKKLTWDQLLEALANDFEGYEEIREMCLAAPKYGNDIPEVDEIATEITQFLGEEARKYKGLHGGRRIVVPPASAAHLYNGVAVGALPSGRKAWMPLSDGISPMQGTDGEGPTAVLKSISKCCLDIYCSPLLNMKLDPSLFRDERGVGDFMGLMKSWHDLGLYHVQFNVISPEILREAQKHPEKYRGLMVRVSGYCAYFVDLYKEIQDEIIARTTFEAAR
jgi:pyruvate formate-lyase/glycerol dehydratase family glycyl radical enzyme